MEISMKTSSGIEFSLRKRTPESTGIQGKSENFRCHVLTAQPAFGSTFPEHDPQAKKPAKLCSENMHRNNR
jgi:hypothetical protein